MTSSTVSDARVYLLDLVQSAVHFAVLLLNTSLLSALEVKYFSKSFVEIMLRARNEGESTVFKGSISFTTYRPTKYFNSPPLTFFAPKSSFCCLDGGGLPADVKAVVLLAALCFTPPGGTCSVN